MRTPTQTLLITILSPLLFFAADIHLSSLSNMWVDNMIVETTWKKFIEKIQNEWETYLIPVCC
jgi:hypothetical protein